MSVKEDLLRRIDTTVKKKKDLSRDIASRKKNVAVWMREFFEELERIKQAGEGYNQLTSFAFDKLIASLHSLDRTSLAILKEPTDGEAQVEVRWSQQYARDANCDEVTVYDMSSVFLQGLIDD
jgi:seryl-tRNA synthetase